MKTIFSFIFLLIFLNVHSQDSLKIKQIDSIVLNINSSDLPVQKDTVILDQPQFGVKMTTDMSIIINDKNLLKYVQNVNGVIKENGNDRQMNTSSTFYYDNNKLIKVEEYLIEGDKKGDMNWYFSDDKLLYYTFESERSEERANMLLTLSKTILNQIFK